MRKTILFMILGSLLLTVGNGLAAVIHHPHTHRSDVHHVAFERKHSQAFIKIADAEKGTENLVDDSIEDEDLNHASSRKCKLLSRYDLTSSCLFLLTDLHTFHLTPVPYTSLSADKYISQRVLRI